MKKLILLIVFLTSGICYSQVQNDFIPIKSKPGDPLSYTQILNFSKSLRWSPYFVVTGSRIDSLMVIGAIFRDSTTLENGVKRYYFKYVDYWVDTTRKINGVRVDSVHQKTWILNHEPDTSKFNFAVGKIPGNLIKYKAEYTSVFDSVYVDSVTQDTVRVYLLSESTIDTVAFSSMYEDEIGNIGINTKFIPFTPPSDSGSNNSFYGITAFDSTGKGFFFEFVSTGDTVGGIAFSSFKDGSVKSNLARITLSIDSTLNLITNKLRIGKDSVSLIKIDSIANFNIPITVKDSAFKVDSSGNIKRIRNKSYDWPTSYGDSVDVDSIKAILVLKDSSGTLKFDTSLVSRFKKIVDSIKFIRVKRDSVSALLISKKDTLKAGFKDYFIDSVLFIRSTDSTRLYFYVKDTVYSAKFKDSVGVAKHLLTDTSAHNFSGLDSLESILIAKKNTAWFLKAYTDDSCRILISNGSGKYILSKIRIVGDSLAGFIDDTSWNDKKQNKFITIEPLHFQTDSNGLNLALGYGYGLILDPEGLDKLIVDTSIIAKKSDLIGTYIDDITWKATKADTLHDHSFEDVHFDTYDMTYFPWIGEDGKLFSSPYSPSSFAPDSTKITEIRNEVIGDSVKIILKKNGVDSLTTKFKLISSDSTITGMNVSRSGDSIILILNRTNGFSNITVKWKDSTGVGLSLDSNKFLSSTRPDTGIAIRLNQLALPIYPGGYTYDGMIILGNSLFYTDNSGFYYSSGWPLSTRTGAYNIGLGYQALINLTSGNANFALGGSALQNLTSGGYNTGVGTGSLFANTTGAQNTAIGTSSLGQNNGSYNVAIGMSSLYYNTSGEYNVGIGYYAGAGCSSGSDNTFLGRQSGRYGSQKNDAINSTAIGAYSFCTQDNQVALGDGNVTHVWTKNRYGVNGFLGYSPTNYTTITYVSNITIDSAGHVTGITKKAMKIVGGIIITADSTIANSFIETNSNLANELQLNINYKSDPEYQEYLKFKTWQAMRKEEIKSNMAINKGDK